MLPDEAVLKSLMTAGLAGQGEPYRSCSISSAAFAGVFQEPAFPRRAL